MNSPSTTQPTSPRLNHPKWQIYLVGLLSCFLALGTTAVGQTAAELASTGRVALVQHDITTANTAFQQALTVDPNNQDANFFYAFTRLAALVTTNGPGTVGGLLDGLGVAASGRTLWGWTADFNRNLYKEIVLPPTSPTSGTIIGVLTNTMLPQITGSIANLGQLNTNYTVALAGEFRWRGNSTAVVNYAEVALSAAALEAMQAAILTVSSYDLNVSTYDLVTKLEAAHNKTGHLDLNADVLTPYPNLLTLAPTAAATLPAAGQTLDSAISIFADAWQTIFEQQGRELCAFNKLQLLQLLQSALTNPVAVAQGGKSISVNLAPFFNGQTNLRHELPNIQTVPGVNRPFIVGDSFPDPSLAGILPTATQQWWTGLLVKNRYLLPTYTPYTFTTLAGNTALTNQWGELVGGYADATGSAALFNYPLGVAVDTNGNVFVADSINHTIRKVTPTGVVTTLAGNPTLTNQWGGHIGGYADGTGSAALFGGSTYGGGPQGLAVDRAGNVIVADANNNTIRLVTPAGIVTTLAGNASAVSTNITTYKSGWVYTNICLGGHSDGTGSAALFLNPQGVALDSAGTIYVADSGNNEIRKITPTVTAGLTNWVVTTLAGSAGITGTNDASGSAAQFNYPTSVVVDNAGNVFVADYYNHTIRKVTPAGAVTTLAGQTLMDQWGTPTGGYVDGTGSTAQFNYPSGVAVDNAGNVFVTDSYNHMIRMVTTAGVVTTLAGVPGVTGTNNGTGSAAQFNYPSGVAVDSAGNLYVADSGNNRISKGTTIGLSLTIITASRLADGTVGTPYYQPLLAFDGRTPYVWSVVSNSLPAGLGLDPSSGTIAGTPTIGITANFRVRVADATTPTPQVAEQDFSLNICGYALSAISTNVTADRSNGSVGMTAGTGCSWDVTADQTWLKTTGSGSGNGTINFTLDANRTFSQRTGTISAAGLTFTVIQAATPNSVGDGIPDWWRAQYFGGNGATTNSQSCATCDPDGDGVNNLAEYLAGSDPDDHTYTWANFAGQPGDSSGNADGTNDAARFAQPFGVAADTNGNVYVADSRNNTIRKVTPAGVVTTLAGRARYFGSADGLGSTARFNHPTGVAVDSGGNVYVADSGNSTIRQVTPAGVVTTLAGNASFITTNFSTYNGITYTNTYTGGYADGTNNTALFSSPSSVAVDNAGNLFVTDQGNNTIRQISPVGSNWVVTTLAGRAGHSGSADGAGSAAQFDQPTGVAVDSAGNLYVASLRSFTIRQVTPAGVVTTLASSRWNMKMTYGSSGVAVDSAGNVYMANSLRSTIHKMSPTVTAGLTNWMVTILAGSTMGYADGTNSAAQFNRPSGIAVDSAGNVFVADQGNNMVREMSLAGTNWVVTTLAGWTGIGSADGAVSTARFYNPAGLAQDNAGNLYVADSNNNTIRKVTAAGVVTTLAGSAGTWGSADGIGGAAQFGTPTGVALDSAGNVFVADQGNGTIRKLTPVGTNWVVSTVAGSAGNWGNVDGFGAAAQFGNPTGVAVDSDGNIFVADQGNNMIRKVNPAGVVTTLAGSTETGGTADGTGSAALFNGPSGVTVDHAGNVFVADSGNNMIRKVTPTGVVTTLAGSQDTNGSDDGTGSAALFNMPTGVAVDNAGNLFIADQGNNVIRKMTAAGVVTTIGGDATSSGWADGSGSSALFNQPTGVVVDNAGNVYVADSGNNRISKGAPVTVATPVIAPAGGTFTNSVTVTMTCATINAIIHYTTDGSVPTASSPTYSSPLTITNSGPVKAIAAATSYANSAVATATFTIYIPPTATIGGTASPANGGSVTGSGTYLVGTNVPLTATAAQYWNFTGWSDGVSTPTRTITVPATNITYTANFVQQTATVTGTASPANGGSVTGTGTFNVNTNVPLTATAAQYWSFTGWSDGVTTATRTITVPATNITYTATFAQQTATIGGVASPATGGSVTGTGTFNVNSTAQLTATAAQYWNFTGWSDGVATATRTITVPATNITYLATFVQQTATVDGAANPTDGGTVTGSGTFPVGTSVQFVATANNGWLFTGWSDGSLNTPDTITVPATNCTYTANFTRQTVAPPTIAPAGGTFTNFVLVTLDCATTGATIYYTIDGSVPTSSSPVYSDPFAVTSTGTINAKGIKTGTPDSPVTAAAFAIVVPTNTVAAPTITPAGGTFTNSVTVTLACTTIGAKIRYTTNGSEPTATSPVYNKPFVVTTTGPVTVNAKAFKAGDNASATTSADFIIALPVVATPTITPTGGTFSNSATVILACATTGATIRYTTDGSEPTSSSKAYSRTAITLTNSVTLKAQAFKKKMADSAVATAAFTVIPPPPLTVTTATLPGGTVKVKYSQSLTATGGTAPYKWALATGNKLPAGLTLNATTGLISGKPTKATTANFTVKVTDAKKQTDSQALTITISN